MKDVKNKEVEKFRKSLMDKFNKAKSQSKSLRDSIYLDAVLAIIETHKVEEND